MHLRREMIMYGGNNRLTALNRKNVTILLVSYDIILVRCAVTAMWSTFLPVVCAFEVFWLINNKKQVTEVATWRLTVNLNLEFKSYRFFQFYNLCLCGVLCLLFLCYFFNKRLTFMCTWPCGHLNWLNKLGNPDLICIDLLLHSPSSSEYCPPYFSSLSSFPFPYSSDHALHFSLGWNCHWTWNYRFGVSCEGWFKCKRLGIDKRNRTLCAICFWVCCNGEV